MKPTHLAPSVYSRPASNVNVERRISESVTLVKTLTAKEPHLQPDEYYARMTFDAARSTAMNPDGSSLDALKPTGRIVVSRNFHSLYLPGCKTCLVRVSSFNQVLVM